MNDDQVDPVPLTPWGKNIRDLYLKYKYTAGWWNNQKPGQFTEVQFAELMLSYEFGPLPDFEEYDNPLFRSDVQEASTHWYYSKCGYELGVACSGVTPNGIFNWIGGGMEVAQSRWRAVFLDAEGNKKPFDPRALRAVTPRSGRDPNLAHRAMSSVMSPPDPSWTKYEGSWANNRPTYWGNEYMFTRVPEQYVWKYGIGPTAWYLLTPLQVAAYK